MHEKMTGTIASSLQKTKEIPYSSLNIISTRKRGVEDPTKQIKTRRRQLIIGMANKPSGGGTIVIVTFVFGERAMVKRPGIR